MATSTLHLPRVPSSHQPSSRPSSRPPSAQGQKYPLSHSHTLSLGSMSSLPGLGAVPGSGLTGSGGLTTPSLSGEGKLGGGVSSALQGATGTKKRRNRPPGFVPGSVGSNPLGGASSAAGGGGASTPGMGQEKRASSSAAGGSTAGGGGGGGGSSGGANNSGSGTATPTLPRTSQPDLSQLSATTFPAPTEAATSPRPPPAIRRRSSGPPPHKEEPTFPSWDHPHLPLAFALLPVLTSLLFGRGELVADLFYVLLLWWYLGVLVHSPWELYTSASLSPSSSSHRLPLLLLTLLSPLLGGLLLALVSRSLTFLPPLPSFSIRLFVLAASVRPIKHLLALWRGELDSLGPLPSDDPLDLSSAPSGAADQQLAAQQKELDSLHQQLQAMSQELGKTREEVRGLVKLVKRQERKAELWRLGLLHASKTAGGVEMGNGHFDSEVSFAEKERATMAMAGGKTRTGLKSDKTAAKGWTVTVWGWQVPLTPGGMFRAVLSLMRAWWQWTLAMLRVGWRVMQGLVPGVGRD